MLSIFGIQSDLLTLIAPHFDTQYDIFLNTFYPIQNTQCICPMCFLKVHEINMPLTFVLTSVHLYQCDHR